jgi:hypothetical protein
MQNPAREILEAIRCFGGRGKLFGVEFRNIKGGFLNVRRPSLTMATRPAGRLSPSPGATSSR